MADNDMALRVTLELEEEWVKNHDTEEIIDNIQQRVNHSLGFRGRVKKLRIIKK